MSNAETAAEPAPPSIRPLVAGPLSQRGVWLFAGAALIGGTMLFAALNAHRAEVTAPSTAPGAEDSGPAIAAPPEIAIPPAFPEQEQAASPAPPAATAPVATAMPQVLTSAPRHIVASNQPPSAMGITSPAFQQPAAQLQSSVPVGPQVVYEAAPASTRPAPPAGAAPGKDERVEASQFAHPATTVPKGTVMQAVLESALDSTRAGMARAIISRDVYGFDGSHVLIPRGSKLIGEYKADLAAGQKRALITWQRLMRPDGAIINLDSPSADPLGRAGVEGKVNTHFLARFGGAILESSLNIGSAVAASQLSGSGAVYALPGLYALPGAVQGTGSQGGIPGAQNVQPTLTVKQGTSVSVFVARDLDFTSVEQ